MQPHGKSGVKGVGWKRTHNAWEARIRVDNKLKSLGLFDNKADAAAAYENAAREHFGEFARSE
jgi:AP2 domain